MPELIAVFVVGLMGSAHCVGMCGGFVMALAQMRGGAQRMQTTQALYFLGKTLTYTLLGLAAGGLGNVLSIAFASLQNVVSILLGLFLIALGLGIIGAVRRLEGVSFWAKLPGLSRAMGTLLQRGGAPSVVGLGMLNGLLPCGLVYGMLAVAAASVSAIQGGLIMAVFGLSTIPVLFLMGVAGFLMRPAWRTRLNFVSGILVIVLGLVTVVRGTPLLEAMHHLHPSHAEAPAAVHEHPHP